MMEISPYKRCLMEIVQRKGMALIFVMPLIVTFLVTSTVDAAGPKTMRKYPIPEHGTLELNVPTSWKVEVHKPQKDMPQPSYINQPRGTIFRFL
jgi:hypothetical protein